MAHLLSAEHDAIILDTGENFKPVIGRSCNTLVDIFLRLSPVNILTEPSEAPTAM